MARKEVLQNRRNTFWKRKLEEGIDKILACLIVYQREDEFVSKSYNVKLVAVMEEDKIAIYCKINDDSICLDRENYDYKIVDFDKSNTVMCYLDILTASLIEENFKIINCTSDFYSKQIIDSVNGEVVLLESVLELE